MLSWKWLCAAACLVYPVSNILILSICTCRSLSVCIQGMPPTPTFPNTLLNQLLSCFCIFYFSLVPILIHGYFHRDVSLAKIEFCIKWTKMQGDVFSRWFIWLEWGSGELDSTSLDLFQWNKIKRTKVLLTFWRGAEYSYMDSKAGARGNSVNASFSFLISTNSLNLLILCNRLQEKGKKEEQSARGGEQIPLFHRAEEGPGRGQGTFDTQVNSSMIQYLFCRWRNWSPKEKKCPITQS